MALSQTEGFMNHKNKTMSFSAFSKLCTEGLRNKVASKSEDKYFTVIEIVQENELDDDSLKLFSKLIPSLLRAGAKDLILALLNNPPKYNPLSPGDYLKSFKAYKDF
jgi:hypothetical protein